MPCRQRAVVDALAARRVAVEQRHDDHARAEVVADQAADDARARDVAAQLLDRRRRAVVVVGHHRAAAEAFLGHLGPAHGRRPQRLDPRAIHARRQDQLVADLAQRVEVARGVDVAIGVLDDDAQRVAQAAQVGAVLEVVLDVRMPARDHLLEARVERQAQHGDHAEQHGQREAGEHHRAAVVEHQPLEARAGVVVEVLERARDGRFGVGGGVHGGRPRSRKVSGWAGPAGRAGRRRPPRPCRRRTTAAAGSGRSMRAARKLAPSSLLTSTCPAWLTITMRPSVSSVLPVRPTCRPVGTLLPAAPARRCCAAACRAGRARRRRARCR